ncbi:hypothetical protein Hypma_006904 [Hypsizygus marmoreus]|uniref:F-box domain-containing protein n=1 Tax=Hypsizygus marmoreus TaxID=39966 RepID=A0A369K1S6_HYPMA|nr:hypothetical protein Hypma_006904 [Hypsizygus marmoreus]
MFPLPIELNSLIFELCTTLSLVSLAQTSISFQILVYAHWKQRNDAVISNYVPLDKVPFFPLLQSTHSAIVGSVAVQLTDNLAYGGTKNLDLVVPPGAFWTWRSMLLEVQYNCGPSCHVSDDTLIASLHSFTNGIRIITVMEMKRPFVFPVLHSRKCSCDMVMVSSSSFIAVYPDTTFDSICVARDCWLLEPEKESHKKRHVDFHYSTANWATACGRYCPDHVENLRNSRSIAALRWNGTWRRDDLLRTVRHHFVGKAYDSEWAFSPGFPACDNTACPNYGYEPAYDESDSD